MSLNENDGIIDIDSLMHTLASVYFVLKSSFH